MNTVSTVNNLSASIQGTARCGLAFTVAYSLGLGGIASARAGTPEPIVGTDATIVTDPQSDPQNDPQPLSQQASELNLPPGPEVARAQSLLVVRRFAEAARLFEALARDRVPSDPRFLYHAGLARMNARQFGLAAYDLRRFLEKATLPGPLRAEIAARQDQACAYAGRVYITITAAGSPLPPSALQEHPLILEATLQGERHRREIQNLAAPALCLDPGNYTLKLRVPGYVPLDILREKLIGPESTAWQLSLVPEKVVVDLRLSPEKALRRSRRSTLTLTDQSHPGSAPIIREAPSAMTTVVLTPGPWRAQVETKRYIADQMLVIHPETRSLDLPLHKRDADSPRFQRNRRALLVAAFYFPISYITGLGLILGGQARERNVEDSYRDFLTEAGLDPDLPVEDPEILAAAEEAVPTAEYHQKLRTAAGLQTAGVALAMNGLTVTVSALPKLLGSKRRVGYIMLGSGAAILAGGAVWMNFYNNKQDELLSPTDPTMRVTKEQFGDIFGHRFGSGMLIGVGSGLLVGSTLSLLLDRRERRRNYSATPFGGRGLVGISLLGDF